MSLAGVLVCSAAVSLQRLQYPSDHFVTITFIKIANYQLTRWILSFLNHRFSNELAPLFLGVSIAKTK